MDKIFLTEIELEKYLASLGVPMSIHKIRKDRLIGKGFPFYKIKGKIVYKKTEVDKEIDSSKIIPKNISA